MVDHHALGASRRARGVIDGDRLHLVLDPRLARLGRGGGEEILVGIPGGPGVVHADHAHTGEIERLDESLQLVVHEDEFRAGVLEDVADLVAAEPRVDRHQHEPGGGHAEVRLEHRGRIGTDEGHAVEMAQPGRAQPRGQTVRALLELAVGIAAGAVDDGDLVGKHVSAAPQERDRRQLGAVRLRLLRNPQHALGVLSGHRS